MPLLHDADIILLLSVDVVGSTAFKSLHPSIGMEPGWVPAMQHFYSHTIRTVMRKLNAVRSARSGFRGRGPMPRLTVHKVIGDEVLFACSPQTPLDFADSLELFTNLVAELNEEYTRDYGFGIHSAAWAATLLSRNRALRIEELDTPEDPYYEFVGPDIDLGFRLIKYCPVGRVIVPGDLPVMLNGYGLLFEQIGTASLQGVTLDPYPVLLTHGGKR